MRRRKEKVFFGISDVFDRRKERRER